MLAKPSPSIVHATMTGGMGVPVSIVVITGITVPGAALSAPPEIGVEDGVTGIMADGLHAIIWERAALATEFAPTVCVVTVITDVRV